MLSSLHIENIAVIERADIEFGGGFNVLTGETGAGKSMVIDSINAVLGARVSRELVRRGAEKALVSAVFTDTDTDRWCSENDIEPEEELIIQRRVNQDGKSSCRVNGVPVSAQQLRQLGAMLLDIHGQNDGRQLLDENEHLAYLDRFGSLEAERAAFDEKYALWRDVKREIERLNMDDIEKERLTESLNYQIQELERADIRPGEEDELTARRDLVKNAGKLTESLEEAYAALYESDMSSITQASEASSLLAHACAYAPELEETVKAINDARYMLEDAAERISDLRGSLDFSPEEYDRIESRLSQLRRLEKKYVKDEQGLIDHLQQCRERLDEIEYSSDRIEKLRRELSARASEAVKAAEALSGARRTAAAVLEARVVDELKYLSMPSVRFVVELQPVDAPEGFISTGADRVRFLISANAGEEPGRIAKIASGGELSRIMLAMKSVFAEKDAVPSLVFDEIDTGVSGIAAQRVGEKIGQLSRSKQIICITHLPQIAAMADTHFAISKSERGGRTYTSVTELDRQGRLRELARLRDGEVITDTALLGAEAQLAAAERFKKSLT